MDMDMDMDMDGDPVLGAEVAAARTSGGSAGGEFVVRTRVRRSGETGELGSKGRTRGWGSCSRRFARRRAWAGLCAALCAANAHPGCTLAALSAALSAAPSAAPTRLPTSALVCRRRAAHRYLVQAADRQPPPDVGRWRVRRFDASSPVELDRRTRLNMTNSRLGPGPAPGICHSAPSAQHLHPARGSPAWTPEAGGGRGF